jgi:predicted RND superfamily exporter protein
MEWRISVSRTPVETLWYLLDVVKGIGYAILFVLLLICLRWLVAMVEDAVKSRKKFNHRFVHPFPSPVEVRKINDDMSLNNPDTSEQTDSTKGETLCA